MLILRLLCHRWWAQVGEIQYRQIRIDDHKSIDQRERERERERGGKRGRQRGRYAETRLRARKGCIQRVSKRVVISCHSPVDMPPALHFRRRQRPSAATLYVSINRLINQSNVCCKQLWKYPTNQKAHLRHRNRATLYTIQICFYRKNS